LFYRLKVNGKDVDIKTKNFDEKTGAFEFGPITLAEGENFVQLYYKDAKAKDYTLGDEVTIKYQKPFALFEWMKKQAALIITALVAAAVAIGVTLYVQKRKTIPPAPPATPVS
jgi:hypothetical protein